MRGGKSSVLSFLLIFIFIKSAALSDANLVTKHCLKLLRKANVYLDSAISAELFAELRF